MSARIFRFRTLLLVASLAAAVFLIGPASDAQPRASGSARTQRTVKRQPIVARMFVRSFNKQSERSRLATVLDAERYHASDPELPGALETIITAARRTGRMSPSVLHAVRVFTQLESPARRDAQIQLLSAQQTGVVAAAAAGLSQQGLPEALRPICALARRPDYDRSYRFRRIVVDAVAQYRQPQSVDFLVQTVERYTGQLKYAAARELTLLTGQNFGGFDDQWRTWWKQNRSDFTAPDQAASKDLDLSELPWPQPVPRFFRMPIYAERVVFLVDRSRSMLSSLDGVTRLQEAQKELEGAIRALNEHTFFNILVYNTEVQRWQSELMLATPEAKSGAIRFAYGLTAEGKTAIYEALDTALDQDPSLEAIIFLTDGKPTAGKITDHDEIVRVITLKNAFRRVSINPIGIDTRGAEARFLDNLARLNSGIFRIIR